MSKRSNPYTDETVNFHAEKKPRIEDNSKDFVDVCIKSKSGEVIHTGTYKTEELISNLCNMCFEKIICSNTYTEWNIQDSKDNKITFVLDR